MLDGETVQKRAGELLKAKGLKPDLSEQAKAVTEAILEAVNEELDAFVLVRQGSTRSQNAVETTPTGRMKKPGLDEVLLQATKMGLPEDEARKFYDFYESKGWKVGNSPMKLWTAALANWKRAWQERSESNGHVSANVEAIKNQSALVRVEERIKRIRGQFPLPADDPGRVELKELKEEQNRLKSLLGFKA